MVQVIRAPGLSDDEDVTLNLLVDQLARRHRRRNRLRSAYYDMHRTIRQVSSVIPPVYNRLAVALGWAGKGVDGLVRRCHIDGMTWTDGAIDSIGLSELEDSNFLYSELSQASTDSLIHGVSFLVTTPGVDDEPRVLVHARDALNGTGEWNNRRRRLDNFLSVTDRDGETITGAVLYMDGVIVSVGRTNGRWAVTGRETHPWHVPVDPMPYMPRSERRLGRSRITRAVMFAQDAAVRTLVRLEAHMDIYAIPKLVMLGADQSIFTNTDGTFKDSWRIVMGRFYGIPDDPDPRSMNPRADVKQFAAESPAPHLAQLNALAKLMARETDLPDSDFALTDMANPTSADAYAASRENLIATAEQAESDWSVPIRRTVTRALAMQNGLPAVPDSWRSINVKWRDPRYLSRSAAADAGLKTITAVPWLADTPLGLELLGLDPQQVAEAMAEKRRAQSQQMLGSIAAAAATAVTDPTMRSQDAAVAG